MKSVVAFYVNLLKAPRLLLKIQSSATAASSLLFSTPNAQQLPLISSSLLLFLKCFFFLCFSLRSHPLHLSLVSSWAFNICLEILCLALSLSFAHCYLDCLPSSSPPHHHHPPFQTCPCGEFLLVSCSSRPGYRFDSWLSNSHDYSGLAGLGGTESIDLKSLDLREKFKTGSWKTSFLEELRHLWNMFTSLEKHPCWEY